MITTSQFSYRNGTFSAFASDFNLDQFVEMMNPAGAHSLTQPRGFRLTSARTGNVITMILDKCHYDRENDLTHWTFKTTHCDAIKELVIWND